MLSGLGTPDLSGRIGKPFYFTSDLFFQPRGGNEFSIEIVELDRQQGDVIETEIKGPPNKLFPSQPEYITHPDADHRRRGQVEARHRGLGRQGSR